MNRLHFLASLALFACIAVLTAWPSHASNHGQPRLVEIRIDGHVSVNDLIRAGLDVVEVKPPIAKVLEWPQDAGTLRRMGVAPKVLDASPGASAAARAREELRSRRPHPGPEHDGASGTLGAPPIGTGSLGGFWTLDEIKLKLDEFVASDVNDVVADQLDTLGLSVQGRPIWGLKLGKSVAGPDPRPIAYFNSLTHAREPASMQALLYFVENILSLYGSDTFATYLLDHRVIYICPVVNPDGYLVNQDIYFSSGDSTFGFWRKNTGDNDSSGVFETMFDGVDLNRNYGYEWGQDDIGSSPFPGHPLYRGPAAFSEPETQIQRDLVTALQPRTVQAFHSYSDVVIYPWGFTGVPPADIDAFREWSDEMVRDNGYQSGYIYPLLGYTVNGEFTDWAYGDSTKPKVYAWTPEVGSDVDFFWPPPSRIEPLAEENLRTCYVTAAIAGAWVQAEDYTVQEGHLNASYGAHVSVRARNLGLEPAGPTLLGQLTPIDAGVQMLESTVAYPTLGSFTSGDPLEPFQLVVDDTVTAGRMLRFLIEWTDPSGFFSRDTVEIPCGTPTVLGSDDASSGLGLWSPGNWGIVTGDPSHPSAYFTDSPGAPYPILNNNAIEWLATFDLSSGVHAYLCFEAAWDIERDYDALYVEASLDGSAWTKLHASTTVAGSGLGVQVMDEPIYTGTRWTWRNDRADLSSFTGPAGSAVHVRFRMRTDGGDPSPTGYPGFSFDSLRVELYDPGAQPELVSVGDPSRPVLLALSAPSPNPVRGAATFTFALPRAGHVQLEVLDVQGRRIETLVSDHRRAGTHAASWSLRAQGSRAVQPGVYFARLKTSLGARTKRFVVVR